MSPFLKGAIGFISCAIAGAIVYHIGKAAGREETLREVENEERKIEQQTKSVKKLEEKKEETTDIIKENDVQETTDEPSQKQSAVKRVREKHGRGLKNTIIEGAGIIKDLFRNPDNKKMVVTVEKGDIVARISPNQGG